MIQAAVLAGNRLEIHPRMWPLTPGFWGLRVRDIPLMEKFSLLRHAQEFRNMG